MFTLLRFLFAFCFPVVQSANEGRIFFPQGVDDECWLRNGAMRAVCVQVLPVRFPPSYVFSKKWSWRRRHPGMPSPVLIGAYQFKYKP